MKPSNEVPLNCAQMELTAEMLEMYYNYFKPGMAPMQSLILAETILDMKMAVLMIKSFEPGRIVTPDGNPAY